MTKRRTAERAVIDAAKEWVEAREAFTNARPRDSLAAMRIIDAGHRLKVTVGGLNDLDLEPALATRTPSLPTPTSEAAAAYMSKRVHNVVGEVFGQILLVNRQSAIGLTTDQIEQRLKRSHQSVSPRVTDLRDQGWIEDSGTTRTTRYGQQAVVWKPTNEAIRVANTIKEWSW